jgi:hypothetical protein
MNSFKCDCGSMGGLNFPSNQWILIGSVYYQVENNLLVPKEISQRSASTGSMVLFGSSPGMKMCTMIGARKLSSIVVNNIKYQSITPSDGIFKDIEIVIPA